MEGLAEMVTFIYTNGMERERKVNLKKKRRSQNEERRKTKNSPSTIPRGFAIKSRVAAGKGTLSHKSSVWKHQKNLSKMNKFAVLFAVTMVTLVAAEAPLPYNYNRPSSGGFSGSSGGSGFGSSGFGGSSFGGSSGGGYQSNEGANVDPQLLEQVRQILLREESQSSSASAPSSQYGAPAAQYGVPSAPAARVVAIQLENTIPSIQVASFSQQSSAPASSGYSYSAPAAAPAPVYSAPAPSYSLPSAGPAPSFSAPSQSYGTPSQSYSSPSAPSGSYGAPPAAPSGSYGAPY